jgi:hypothetical protein
MVILSLDIRRLKDILDRAGGKLRRAKVTQNEVIIDELEMKNTCKRSPTLGHAHANFATITLCKRVRPIGPKYT